MHMKPFLLSLALCAAVSAQIEKPAVGWIIDRNNDLRLASGIAASATLGDSILRNLLALACSEKLCIGKTEETVLASSGHITPAPEGPALFALDGENAYVYFSSTNELKRWHAGEFSPIEFSPDGQVLAIRANGGGIDYAIRRGEETFVEHLSFKDQSIAITAALGKTGAVALHQAGVLMETGGQLQLLRTDGFAITFEISEVTALWQITASDIEAATVNERWIISLTPHRETANLLPGVEK